MEPSSSSEGSYTTSLRVVLRFDVAPAQAIAFREQSLAALEVLATRPGHQASLLGRAADDSGLWTATLDWESVGAYRRALSCYEVRLGAVPWLSAARDEPTAFEVLYGCGPAGSDAVEGRSVLAADANTVGLGWAAGPDIATDLSATGERSGSAAERAAARWGDS